MEGRVERWDGMSEWEKKKKKEKRERNKSVKISAVSACLESVPGCGLGVADGRFDFCSFGPYHMGSEPKS